MSPVHRQLLTVCLLAAGVVHAPACAVAQDAPPAKAADMGGALPVGAVARMGGGRLRHLYAGLVFAADSKTLLSWGSYNTVRLWDVPSGDERRRFPGGEGWWGQVALSPDGKTAAAGRGDDTVHLLDLATGREVRRFTTGGDRPVCGVAFSPDGRFLATSAGGNHALLWDVATGRHVRTLEGAPAPATSGHCLSFHAGGTLLAGTDGHLWEVATGRQLWPPPHGTAEKSCVAFSPDSKRVAAAGRNNVLWLMDRATGRLLFRLDGHRDLVYGLAFSPDGKTLASAGHDRAVRLWDVTTGRERRRLLGHTGPVLSVAFAPDGKTLASAGADRRIALWDVGTGRELQPFEGHRDGVRHVSFSADGTLLATAGRDGRLFVYEARTGASVCRPAGHRGEVRGIAFRPDGKVLASSGGDGGICLWDTAGGAELRRFGREYGDGAWLAFSPDGKVLASAGVRVCLWDAASGRQLRRLGDYHDLSFALAYAPDGKALAVGYPGCRVVVWDPAAGAVVRTLDPLAGPDFTTRALSLSADGRTLAVPGAVTGHTPLVWDVPTGKRRPPFHLGEHGWFETVALSPDGRTLATDGPDGGVWLWEVATGGKRCVFRAGCGRVECLAFTADGRLLASGHSDGSALTWDAAAARHEAPRPLNALWAALADADAAAAYRAVCTLAAAPDRAVPFLERRLGEPGGEDASVIRGLLADLDAKRFATRERATRALEKLGRRAEPALRQALLSPPSLEVQRRMEGVLDKLERLGLARSGPEWLRAVRTVEVLERINSRDARRLLERHAAAGPSTWLTLEARLALERLRRRPPM
jgi:WD40 repeat protein